MERKIAETVHEDISGDMLAVLNLRKLTKNKRGTLYGFHVKLEGQYAKRLLERGVYVIIIRETDKYIGRIKERLPVIKMKHSCRQDSTKDDENVIPAKAGIQKAKLLDSRPRLLPSRACLKTAGMTEVEAF